MENNKKGASPKKKNDEKVLIVGVGAPAKGTEKIEKSKVVKLPEPKVKVLTLDEKILKVQKMNDLVGKRKKLTEAIVKLDRFCFSDGELETVLNINDGKTYNGIEFNTTNTIIIDEVAEFLKVKIFKKVEIVEAEIEALV